VHAADVRRGRGHGSGRESEAGDVTEQRDLTKTQFGKACARYGFKAEFMGYYDVGNGWCVNVLNAGDRRRDRLAYLIKQSELAVTEAQT
jgi:hypothetical protein